MLRAVGAVSARAAGAWTARRAGETPAVAVEPFSPLAPADAAALDAEAAGLGRFEGLVPA